MNAPTIKFSYKKNKYLFSNLEIKSLYDYNITALCGHNGAGKTTLLKILAGIYPYDNKTKKIKYKSKWFIGSNRSGLISNLTLKDHLNLLSDLIQKDKDTINTLIIKFELKELLDSPIFELSDGQFIKAALLLAIICNPEYLFLDEVFSPLDYVSLKVILEEIFKLKNSTHIIFASHNLDIVSEISDRILIIKNGTFEFDSIIENQKEQLTSEKLKKLYIQRS
jgi:ABC-type multidrug transport system ATPase subunit